MTEDQCTRIVDAITALAYAVKEVDVGCSYDTGIMSQWDREAELATILMEVFGDGQG